MHAVQQYATSSDDVAARVAHVLQRTSCIWSLPLIPDEGSSLQHVSNNIHMQDAMIAHCVHGMHESLCTLLPASLQTVHRLHSKPVRLVPHDSVTSLQHGKLLYS